LRSPSLLPNTCLGLFCWW